MFTVDLLTDLFQHMTWADATVWRAALAHEAAGNDLALRERLLHICVVQTAFLRVWKGQPVVFPELSDLPTLVAVHEWGRSYYAEAREFLRTLNAKVLDRQVVMPWVKEYERQVGRIFETPTLGETVFQVTSHSTYHRGQVNIRLRELGAEPPLVDYIAWIWFGRPAPETAPTAP